MLIKYSPKIYPFDGIDGSFPPIGHFITDMHGVSFIDHVNLNEAFEIKGIIEILNDEDACYAFLNWIKTVLTNHPGIHRNYVNKMLVVMGKETFEGFYPCAYTKDTNHVGLALLKAR